MDIHYRRMKFNDEDTLPRLAAWLVRRFREAQRRSSEAAGILRKFNIPICDIEHAWEEQQDTQLRKPAPKFRPSRIGTHHD